MAYKNGQLPASALKNIPGGRLEINADLTKKCSKCSEEKLLEDFYKSKRGKLGRRADCKSCQESSRRKRTGAREKVKVDEGYRHCYKCSTTYPISNFHIGTLEKDSKYGRAFDCKDCRNKRKRQELKNNPEAREKSREYSRKWYRDNLEYAKEQGRIQQAKWREENAEKHRQNAKNYRADPSKKEILWKQSAKKRAIFKESFVEEVDRWLVYNRDGRICGICEKYIESFDDDFQLDHVIPLSRGGKHCYTNVQASHGLCNNKKNARTMEEIEGVF